MAMRMEGKPLRALRTLPMPIPLPRISSLLVVLAVCVVPMPVLAQSGDGPGDDPSPAEDRAAARAVLRAFLDAALEGDTDAALSRVHAAGLDVSLITVALRRRLHPDSESELAEATIAEGRTEDQDVGTFRVTVVRTRPGRRHRETIEDYRFSREWTLERVDGEWRIPFSEVRLQRNPIDVVQQYLEAETPAQARQCLSPEDRRRFAAMFRPDPRERDDDEDGQTWSIGNMTLSPERAVIEVLVENPALREQFRLPEEADVTLHIDMVCRPDGGEWYLDWSACLRASMTAMNEFLRRMIREGMLGTRPPQDPPDDPQDPDTTDPETDPQEDPEPEWPQPGRPGHDPAHDNR